MGPQVLIIDKSQLSCIILQTALRRAGIESVAYADGREVFRPLVEMSPEERRQVITLPPSVGKLTAVKHLVLYRSSLVRLAR